MKTQQEWVFVLTTDIMNEYARHYFKLHPKARKHPLLTGKLKNITPIMPSQNQTMAMVRMAENNLKQKWKDFIIWWVEKLGWSNLMINEVEVYIDFYFWNMTDRDITDNYNLKFINDGLTASGFLLEDNCWELQQAHYRFRGLDRKFPRTVITFKKLKEEDIVKVEEKKNGKRATKN